MSRMLLCKVDIDAYVTVALRWTGRGDVAHLPEPARDVLRVTTDNASEIGQRLWWGNVRGFVEIDEELLADDPGAVEDLRETRAWWESVTPYVFEELPGDPHPETALRRADFYAYQSAGDHWEEWHAETDGPPFEATFTMLVKWYALSLLGLVSSSTPPYDPFDPELRVDLHGSRVYDASGWALGDGDRDLFTRSAALGE